MNPIDLENLIEVYRTVGTLEPNKELARKHFERMERERGLRAP